MTKKEALAEWRAHYLPEIRQAEEKRGHRDLPGRRESWNNYTDALQKGGRINMRQYETWTHPPEND